MSYCFGFGLTRPAKAPVDLCTATTATYIAIEAAPDRADDLAAPLTAAGPIVAETEPETLFWVALRIDESNFAIYDIFADNSGREAHFAGQVASLLNAQAFELVKGGWNDGVVANVRNFDILAIKCLQYRKRREPCRKGWALLLLLFGRAIQSVLGNTLQCGAD